MNDEIERSNVITLPGEVLERDVVQPHETEGVIQTDAPPFDEVRDLLVNAPPPRRPNRSRPVKE